MWINYIGEIAMGFFVFLMIVHFALHFIFKMQRIKRDKQAEKSKQAPSSK